MEHALGLEEMRLVEGLRNRDEQAFEQLIRMYQAALLRVALMYVSSRAIAEDVVQESWVAVLNGIDRFEGRSSLKTWIFRIVANRAKTRLGTTPTAWLPLKMASPDTVGKKNR